MRKITLALFLWGVFSFGANILSAQNLTYSVQNQVVNCEEDKTTVEIIVENFDTIGSLQFAVVWDSAVLQYAGSDNLFPPAAILNPNRTSSGELRVGWFDFAPPFDGEDLPDSTIILTMRFNLLAGGGSMSPVEIVELPGYTLQASDNHGIITKSQIVVNQGSVLIADNEPPVLSDCPDNISTAILPSETTANVTWTVPTATDNCNVDTIFSSPSISDDFPVGTTTVTYSAIDDAGNVDECDFTVTVAQDVTAGKLRFELAATDVSCTDDSLGIDLKVFNFDTINTFQFGLVWDTTVVEYKRHIDFLPAASQIDIDSAGKGEIGIAWLDFTPVLGETFQDSFTIIRFVFDLVGAAGKTTDLDFQALSDLKIEVSKNGAVLDPSEYVFTKGNISISDTIAPAISDCPNTINVSVLPGSMSRPVDWDVPTATDNCNVASFNSNFTSGDDFSVGTTVVEYIAFDDMMNSDTCTFDVVVSENPNADMLMFKMENISIDCNDSTASADIRVSNFDSITTFQWGIIWDTAVLKYASNQVFLPQMAIPNTDSVSHGEFGLPWLAFQDPFYLNLQDDSIILRLNFDIVGELGDVSPLQFADLDFLKKEVSQHRVGKLSDSEVVYIDAELKIEDIQKPVFQNCPSDRIIDAELTRCGAEVSWDDLVASDNCTTDVVITKLTTQNSGDFFAADMSEEVIYTATDDEGNSDTCRFTIAVKDLSVPVLRCRTDTTVTVAASPTTVGNLALIGAADNCGVDTIYYQLSDPAMTSGDADASNQSFEEGMTTVTYFGMDEAGNTGQCSFNVTVVINDPKDIELQCPNPSPISNELTLCDAEVSGLGLIVLNGAGDLTDTTFVINASTPINGDDDASGNRFEVGTTTVTYTVTDVNGDEHTCDFVVTVEDNEMPMLTCPDDLSVTIPAGDCDVPVSWTGEMVSDNCPGNISLSPDMTPGTSLGAGVHVVTYTARDMAANEITCSFEITVTGGGKPLFSGTPVDTILNTDTMMCSAAYTWIPPTATSSCGTIDSLIGSHDHLGTTFPEGVNEVSYVAYTSFGSTDTLRFTVTVEDKESPVITGCPRDTIVFADPATCTATVNWTPTTATDNCGIFDYFRTHQPDYQFPPSALPTAVLLIASDSSGNTTICNFEVTVVDTVKPYFANCPEAVSVFVDGTIVSDADDFILFSDNDNCMGARLFFSPPSHTDTCGFATLAFPTDPNLMSGSSFGVGAYELVYTATDGAGNSADCKVEITVNPMPALNATANKTAACEGEDIMLSATIPGANYTYEWTGPNSFLQQEIDPVISNITAVAAGDYTLTATSPVGCTVSETISISVSGKPQLEITHNDILCASGVSDLEIMATEMTGATIAFWSWTGPNGFTDNQQNPIVSNATPDDSGIYKVMATTAGGCVDSTELDIQISDMPVMPTLAPVGDDFELCEGETSTFLGSMLTGQTVQYFWEVSPDNGVDWTPSNINALAMTFNQAGNFTVRYWGSVDGCLSDTAEVLISVKTAPTVALGSNAPILCADGTQDLELVVNGSADSYEWSGPNSFSVTDKNPIREDVTGADAGFYTLKATNGDGCTFEQNIDIEITEGPSPQQPFATPDNSSICLGEAHRIDGQAYSSNAGVVYRWFASPSAGSGLPLVATNRVIQAVPTVAGNYTFKYVVEVGGCATDTAEVSLTVNDLPEVVLDYNNPLTCITEGMNLILSETAGEATSWDWSGPQGFSSVNKTPVVSNITKDNAGTYTVNVEDDNGCKNTGSIDVVISDGIIPLDISINNINPCEDLDSLILETQMIPGATYNWTGPVNITTTTNQVIVPAATAEFSGMYTVSATTADGCASPVSDPMEVEVLDAPVTGNDYVLVLFETPILIDVLGNDVFNMTRPFNISVVSPPTRGTVENLKDGRFNYTPDDKELDEDYMTYEICYDECEMLCSRAIVTFDIKHDPNQCVVPTVITPNNDGKNDMLHVSCVEAGTFPENQIMIFNEWGDEVFEAAPYNNDWDGTYNGKPVPDGTYYYLFFRTPGSEPQKGFITVFR